MDGPFKSWNKKLDDYEHSQEGQEEVYADVIAWGKENGLAGIRYWAPDYKGWYTMAMFDFEDKEGSAKSILLNHKKLLEK